MLGNDLPSCLWDFQMCIKELLWCCALENFGIRDAIIQAKGNILGCHDAACREVGVDFFKLGGQILF